MRAMRRRRTTLVGAAVLTVAAVTAASCSDPTAGDGSGEQPQSGGSITMALAEAPDMLDPTFAQTYVGRIVFANVCEKLYDINADVEVVPQLAADLPEISEDGTVYTIPLREGVAFNDGTDFDAEAVKTSLERHMNHEESSRASELQAVEEVTAVDPTTVRLTLSEPYAPLLAILSDRSGMIMSPAQLDELGDDFADEPVCVGPFQFADRPSNDRIELTKSEHYYDQDQVRLDELTFTAVSQPNVRAANLRSGDVQVSDRIQPPDVESLENDSGTRLDTVTSLGYQGITINVSNSNGAANPPFETVDTPLAQHPELRQALSLALDREAINEVVFQGQYVPGCSPISPVSPFATDSPCPGRDVERAQQLVADSGVDTPIPVELVIQAGDQQAIELGTVIQGMAEEVGFEVEVQPVEFTTALDQSRQGDFEAFQVGWSGRIDPDQNIDPFWSPESTLNYSGANYDDVQRLLADARASTDDAERTQIYAELVEVLRERANILYLYHPKVILGVRGNVDGIGFYPDGIVRFKTAHFTG